MWEALILINYRAIPVKAESLQRVQNMICRAGDHPGSIDIFNPQQPMAAFAASHQKTAQRRDQGAEMQWTTGEGAKRPHGGSRPEAVESGGEKSSCTVPTILPGLTGWFVFP